MEVVTQEPNLDTFERKLLWRSTAQIVGKYLYHCSHGTDTMPPILHIDLGTAQYQNTGARTTYLNHKAVEKYTYTCSS